MVTVGQKLALMCIGQDVRGNIKLSLKAALSKPGAEAKKAVEGCAPGDKEATNVWASVGNASDGQNLEFPTIKSETAETNSYSSSTPAIVIRSAAECEEEEKTSGLSQSSRSRSKSTVASEGDSKSKKSMPLVDGIDSGKHDGKSDMESKVETLVSTRNLKLGTIVTAKVYQIRARGLVLDLGGGIRGMYRFEVCISHCFQMENCHDKVDHDNACYFYLIFEFSLHSSQTLAFTCNILVCLCTKSKAI